jgi:uncharacterized protein YjbI with pentapeptide repeats
LGLAQLDGAEFIDCAMPMAEFDGASLVGVRFVGGLLNAASFHAARLLGATFEGPNLSGASFEGASLDACTFGTDVSKAVLSGALYTRATAWPPGFDPVGAQMRLVAEPTP